MPDYSLVIESASAFGILILAFITFYIEIGKRWLEKPKLEIKFQEREGKSPYIHYRTDVKENRIITKSIGGGRRKYRKGKELELDVINRGKIPAYNCEAKCKVWKDGKFQAVEPLILDWRRRQPFDKFFEPITINRNDFEELGFLVLLYWIEEGKEEHEHGFGMEIEDLIMESVKTMDIEKNKRYDFEVTVFSENSEPVQKRFELEWSGRFNLEECIKPV